MKECDVLIAGCGYAGIVLAERLASQCGLHCLIVERRAHIGGNSYDAHDAAGVLLHKYGPHYFRTNSDRKQYQGWVIGYDTKGKFRTAWTAWAPGGGRNQGGGVWMSGAGLASAGNQIFFTTGNGFQPSTFGHLGFPF